MAAPDKRRWPSIAALYALLLLVVGAAAGFIHDSAAPANRPMVIRLAVGLVVAVALIHLRVHFRRARRWQPPSVFAAALRRQPIEAKLDPGFIRLREQVANGSASRSYFDKVLWPRLLALARARGGA